MGLLSSRGAAAGWALAALLLGGCAGIPSPAERLAEADRLAASQGWQRTWLEGGAFRLAAYHPAIAAPTGPLTVYLEGDGLAWISADQASVDPTPSDPLALRLAMAQGGDAVAYLGRPCQYVGAAVTGCPQRYWTQQRFALDVVDATSQALDQLKRRFSAHRLRLVGYSGGGTVAALVAARRNDVDLLVTVAGNLDTAAWTAWHRVTALNGSLNPADETDALSRVRQHHFAGGQDRTVPPGLLTGFVSRLRASAPVRWQLEPTFDHRCCWEQAWTQRLQAAAAE